MNKIALIPGQESFLIEEPLQSQEPFSPVPYLSEKDGFIELEDLPGFDLDWQREVTMVGLMGEIGIALSSEPAQSETTDQELAAYEKDFEKVLPKVIEPSLYYSGWVARRRTDVLMVDWAEPTYTGPGVIAQDEGVAVTGTEFRTFSKSAELLAKHAVAHVGKSIESPKRKGQKISDEDARNSKGRAGAHAMEVRMPMLTGMDRVLGLELIGLSTFRELAVFDKDAQKLPLGEMDFYRRVGLFSILQMVRVASAQLDYGTNEREGAVRALTTIFTRLKRPERRAEAMRAYALAGIKYTNAKRGKVSQAYSDCEIVYKKYKPFLKTKEPKLDIA